MRWDKRTPPPYFFAFRLACRVRLAPQGWVKGDGWAWLKVRLGKQ